MAEVQRDECGNEVYPGRRLSSIVTYRPDFEICDEKPAPVKKKVSGPNVFVMCFLVAVATIMFVTCTANHNKELTDPNKNADLHESIIKQLQKDGWTVRDRGIFKKNQRGDILVDNPPEISAWKIVTDKQIRLELSRGGIIKDTITLKGGEIKDFGELDYDQFYQLKITCIGLFNNTRIAYLTTRKPFKPRI